MNGAPWTTLPNAAASERSWPRGSVASFLEASVRVVPDAMRHLDLIVFLPVASRGIRPRSHENPRFRKRVDAVMRRALIDDDYDLFGETTSPRVVELSPCPERRLAELARCVRSGQISSMRP